MTFDDFWNYLNENLKSANNELNYCIRGLHGDKECNDDNPDTSHEDWVVSIQYAEQDIYELESAKKILKRFEESLEVEE